MNTPTNWAGMLPRTPRPNHQAVTSTTDTPSAATPASPSSFNGLAGHTYRVRRERATGTSTAATVPCAIGALTAEDQGAYLDDLAAKVYSKRATERARCRERAADDAFRLATERGPDGGGGPWGGE